MPLNPILEGFAGVDEAGRGPWAGPVVVAAVLLDPTRPILGLGDSKVLSEKRREELFPLVQQQALAWSIQFISAEQIDQMNILQATFLGMRQAVAAVHQTLSLQGALIDGNKVPPQLCVPGRAIVKGDGSEPAIAAASVLAKVARDRHLLELEAAYPHYGFAKHKGYGTALHMKALEQFGPCAEHRKTFAPIAKLLSKNAH